MAKRGPKKPTGKKSVVDEADDLGLRVKMERFAQEYIKDFNGTRAAIAAGYSETSAAVIACENLRKPNIKKRIDELLETKLAAAAVTEERIIERLAQIAFGDPRKVAEFKNGKLSITDSDKLTRAEAGMIAAMSEETGNKRKREIKFHDPIRAAELLGKTKKMFTDKVEHEGMVAVTFNDSIPDDEPPAPGDIGKKDLPTSDAAPQEPQNADQPTRNNG